MRIKTDYREALILCRRAFNAIKTTSRDITNGFIISSPIKPYFERAIKLCPELAIAHNGLGWCLASRGELELALASFVTATNLAPNYFDAWFNRAIMLWKLGRESEAVADLTVVINAEKEGASDCLIDALFVRAQVTEPMSPSRAIRDYEALLALDLPVGMGAIIINRIKNLKGSNS